MSNMTSPVSVVFDLQRTTIEQTHDAITRSVETQQNVSERLVDFGPAMQAQEQSYDAVRSVVDLYFDAVESVMPQQSAQFDIDELRGTMDDQLDSLETTQSEAMETLEESLYEGNESATELREEFLSMLDEQVETMLDAHEDAESQTVDVVDDVADTLEELVDEFEARSEELTETVEKQVEEFDAQIEDASETANQQVEVQVDAVSESLEAINGLGPTYAARLQEQGIESFDALANANAEMIATAADVSEKQAQSWIDAAQAEA